jgi:hypothetical protein
MFTKRNLVEPTEEEIANFFRAAAQIEAVQYWSQIAWDGTVSDDVGSEAGHELFCELRLLGGKLYPDRNIDTFAKNIKILKNELGWDSVSRTNRGQPKTR